MKKKILFISALFAGVTVISAQVGVNTTDPKTTLHIVGTNDKAAVTAADGVLVPRVNALTANGAEDGQLVFLIADNGTFKKGFHYWNVDTTTPANSAWVPITDAEAIAASAEVTRIGTDNIVSSKAGVNSNGSTVGSGSANLVLGDQAGGSMTSGSSNVFLGEFAGGDIASPGDNNVYVGKSAGLLNRGNAGENIGVGFNALNNTRGSDGTGNAGNNTLAVGVGAFASSGLGNFNLGLGYFAGRNANVSLRNVLIGKSVAQGTGSVKTDIGSDNIAIGTDAFRESVIESSNIVLGNQAAKDANIGNDNIIQGTNALQGTDDGTTKTFATAVDNNILMGKDAGKAAAVSMHNVMLGYGVAENSTFSGNSTVALGTFSGRNTTTAAANIFIGSFSGTGNSATDKSILADNNLIIGAGAGRRVDIDSYNNFLSYQSGVDAEAGENNTLFGHWAGRLINMQDDNMIFGRETAVSQTIGSNNIMIGTEIDFATSGTTGATSNQLNIQNAIFGTGNDGTGTTVASAGKIGIGQPAPTERLDVAGTAKADNFIMKYQLNGTIDASSGFVNATSNVALPTAAIFKAGKLLYIKNTNANSINVTPNGTETIDGVTGARPIATYQTLVLISTGTEWLEVSEM